MSKKIFLSFVTNEFGTIRLRLADLIRHLRVAFAIHQEEFAETGKKTLPKISKYVSECDYVIHVIGESAGRAPPQEQVNQLLNSPRLKGFSSRFPRVAELAMEGKVSYTQWEAWLALFFGIELCCFQLIPESNELQTNLTASEHLSQAKHLQMLCDIKKYPKKCSSEASLYNQILVTLHENRVLTHDQFTEVYTGSKLEELGESKRSDFFKELASYCEETIGQSLIDIHEKRLQGNSNLLFVNEEGLQKQSLGLELHRKLITGATPIAQDLRRIYPAGVGPKGLYLKRRIDEHFASFLNQYDKNVFVFANRSGAGKSTFLAYTAFHLSLEGNLVFFLTGSQLAVSRVDGSILNKTMNESAYRPEDLSFSARRLLYVGNTNKVEIKRLIEYVQQQPTHREVIFFIDALDRANEVSPEKLESAIIDFCKELTPEGSKSNIRIVISCRTEVWQSKRLSSLFVAEKGMLHRHTYFSPNLLQPARQQVGSANLEAETMTSNTNGINEIVEGWYTEETCRDAFEIYQGYYNLDFVEDIARFVVANMQLLREPLAMRIFFETHAGKAEIKRNALKKWELLSDYVERKRHGIREKLIISYPVFDENGPFDSCIDQLITSSILHFSIEVFRSGSNSIRKQEAVKKTAIWLKDVLLERPFFLLLENAASLEFAREKNRAFKSWLLDQVDDLEALVHCLIQASLQVDLLSEEGRQIRFTLDLYFEFCLGRGIGNVISHGQQTPSEILATTLRHPNRTLLELELPEQTKYPLIPSQFTQNALKFAVLHLESLAQNTSQADTMHLAIDCLNFLTTQSFSLQTLASEIICEMSTFQMSPRQTAFTENETVEVVTAVLNRCLLPISNKGDFVYRFALRQAIVALRKHHKVFVDDVLSDWLEVDPESTASTDLSSTAEMLRFVAMVDALSEGQNSEQIQDSNDFTNLLNCLHEDENQDDIELNFWTKRFVAVSLTQFIYRQNEMRSKSIVSYSTEELEDWMVQHNHLEQRLKCLINESRVDFEQAMLSEQYVYFVFATQRSNFTPILNWLETNLNPWQTYSLLFGIINVHNLWIFKREYSNAWQPNVEEWRILFDKFICVVLTLAQNLIDKNKSQFHESIIGRLLEGLNEIKLRPDTPLKQEILFPNVPFDPSTECNPGKIQVAFSSEFFSTYFDNHHECRERVYCLLEKLDSLENDPDFSGTIEFFEPDRIDPKWLDRAFISLGPAIHEEDYVNQVKWLSEQLETHGATREEAKQLQVKIRPGSWWAALRSAGATQRAFDAALMNQKHVAISLNRPPGHLATNQICIFNNIAASVRYAQKKLMEQDYSHAPPNVTVFDFDAHHGSHIQNSFYCDRSVSYVSIHQDNIYPGNGFTWQIGRDDTALHNDYFGCGTTMNLPVPENANFELCRNFIHSELREHLQLHQPKAIFIAFGADADFRDPFNQLKFEPRCFFEYGVAISNWRRAQVNEGQFNDLVPVTVAFEGGFALVNGGTAQCFESFLRGLLFEGKSEDKHMINAPIFPLMKRHEDSVRSIVSEIRTSRRRKKNEALNLHGDVCSILESRVAADDMSKFTLQPMSFGLGGGAFGSSAEQALPNFGEILVINGKGFFQCPKTQKTMMNDECYSSFFVSWRSRVDLWLRYRTWHAIGFQELLRNLNRAIDSPFSTYSLVGALRVETIASIKEKRIALAPTKRNLEILNKSHGEKLKSILAPEIFDSYFATGLDEHIKLDRTLLISGICQRSGPNYVRQQMLPSEKTRCFYGSGLSLDSINQFAPNHHIHFGMSRGSELDNIWVASPIRSLDFFDALTNIEQTIRLVSHLEDALITDAYLGIQFLNPTQLVKNDNFVDQ